MPGFTLTTDQPAQCRINCQGYCATCDSMNPFSCNTCLAGYTLVNGACQPDTSCNNNAICQVCPFGYSISSASTTIVFNQTCQQCNQSNCARCDSISQECHSCLTGYYLSGSACTQCSLGCATCLGEKFCLSCASGFTVQ